MMNAQGTSTNAYAQQLQQVVELAIQLRGTGGGRALHKIIMDLEGNGPIAELLHTLDHDNFALVIALLEEFRRSGRQVNFNALHAQATQAISESSDD